MTLLTAILIVCTIVVAGFAVVGLMASFAERRFPTGGLVACCVAGALGWYTYQELGEVFEWDYIPLSFAMLYAEFFR